MNLFTMASRVSSVFARIVTWNRVRNGLILDPNLEAKMLSEEANEFYMAETLVDRIDAYCDFLFVALGTIAKRNAQKLTGFTALQQNVTEGDTLMTYIETTLGTMLILLEEEFSVIFKQGAAAALTETLTKAFNIVVTANEAKGTEKDADGKVKKGPNYQKPEPQIEALLADVKRKYCAKGVN